MGDWKRRELHRTQPHGSQRILLSEDYPKFENRVYVVLNEDGKWIPILGSELKSIGAWLSRERVREGSYEEAGFIPEAVWGFVKEVRDDRDAFVAEQ